jgi:hypothetical protein
MSGRLISVVLESALPSWLKVYAVAFASFATDDGARVYPSIGRIARMVSRSERQVQRAATELRRLRVLEIIAPSGRNTATRYQFNAGRLPLPGDGEQLPIFFDVLPFPQRKAEKHSAKKRFPQLPQALTGTPCHPRGDTHVTRSVSRSVKYSTYTRARAKTGTGE